MCSNTHGIFVHGHFSLLWEINNKIIIPINTKFVTVKRRKEGRKERGKDGKKEERRKKEIHTPNSQGNHRYYFGGVPSRLFLCMYIKI